MSIEKDVEDFAKLQFNNDDLATIMAISKDELLEKYQENISRGRLLAQADVRTAMLKAAKEGNTAAQKEIMRLNRQIKAQEANR